MDLHLGKKEKSATEEDPGKALQVAFMKNGYQLTQAVNYQHWDEMPFGDQAQYRHLAEVIGDMIPEPPVRSKK